MFDEAAATLDTEAPAALDRDAQAILIAEGGQIVPPSASPVTAALILLALLLALVAMVFAASALLPGDLAARVLGRNPDPARLGLLRTRPGPDRPAAPRFLDGLGGTLRRDLGMRPVGLRWWPCTPPLRWSVPGSGPTTPRRCAPAGRSPAGRRRGFWPRRPAAVCAPSSLPCPTCLPPRRRPRPDAAGRTVRHAESGAARRDALETGAESA